MSIARTILSLKFPALLAGVFMMAVAGDNKPPPSPPSDELPSFLHRRGSLAEYRPDNEGRQYAINCNYILQTGRIFSDDRNFLNDNLIDWHAPDSFITTLQIIEDNVCRIIRHDEGLQTLLHKDIWTKSDRETWEETVSNIIRSEISKIPALWEWRNIQYTVDNPGDVHALNELADDIDHKTLKHRNACREKSIVHGTKLQRMDNIFLPKDGVPGSYKRALDYFIIGGTVCQTRHSMPTDHCFVLTPAGNIYEATFIDDMNDEINYGGLKVTNVNGYKRVRAPGNFEAFLRGHKVVTNDDNLYATCDIDRARDYARCDFAVNGLNEDGVVFSADRLLECANADTAAALTPDKNFIVVSSHTGPVCSVRLYQKVNRDMPEEGYLFVSEAMGAAGFGPDDNAPSPVSGFYDDKITGKEYRFDASFSAHAITSSVAMTGQLSAAPAAPVVLKKVRRGIDINKLLEPQTGGINFFPTFQ